MKIIFLIIFLVSQFTTSIFNEQNSASKSTEVLIIYFGSSQCSFCTSEDNKVYFDQIVKKIKEKNNLSVVTKGVSLDEQIEDGYEFLYKLNDFDEIVIGDKYNNSAFFKYVINDYKGVAVVPQIVIMLRTTEEVSNNLPLDIKSEEFLYRIVGINKMEIFSNLVEDIDFNKFISVD